jgi:uncharacterized membrane protein YkoI
MPTMKKDRYILAATVTTLVLSLAAWAQETPGKEPAELAKAVSAAKVSLEKGLLASATEGKPISAKFEVEDGKLQFSVYAMKGDKFYEVVIDHQTGKIAKTEPITEGEDLAAAKSQSEAMAKARLSLREAVSKAVAEHKGFLAVSALAKLRDGHPVANVSLVKGEESEAVTEKLD